MSQHSRQEAQLAEQVKVAFHANRRVYGSPRIHAELRAQGIRCAQKRVARLMREQGLVAKRASHRTVTTTSVNRMLWWLLTCSCATSAPRRPPPNGWPIRPTFGLRKGGCTWRWCLMCFRGRWEDGLWPLSRMPRWSVRRCAWPSLAVVRRPAYSITRIVGGPPRARAIKPFCCKKVWW
jgi:transposase InsO family protein